MGQYHVIVNADKRQFINPHSLGDGYKLREFGNSAGGATTALIMLLAVSNGDGGRGGGDYHQTAEVIGSWGGDRIAVVGDYAQDTDLPTTFDPQPSTIFRRCLSRGETKADVLRDYPDLDPSLPFYREVGADVRKVLAAEGDFTYKVETSRTRHLDGTVTEYPFVTRIR